jgi:hypothetical protein
MPDFLPSAGPHAHSIYTFTSFYKVGNIFQHIGAPLGPQVLAKMRKLYVRITWMLNKHLTSPWIR